MEQALCSRLEEIEQSYRSRAPGGGTPFRERLLYHAGRLVEFTWNANAYARSKESSAGPQRHIIGLLRTDVFLCILASAKLLGETIAEASADEMPRDFHRGWLALVSLLGKVDTVGQRVEDLTARTVFFVLFISMRILRQSLNSDPEARQLDEADVFNSEAFGLPEAERSLLATLAVSPFEGGLASPIQLDSVIANCHALEQLIETTATR